MLRNDPQRGVDVIYDPVGGAHPSGTGFVPDLRAFVAWAKTPSSQPLE